MYSLEGLWQFLSVPTCLSEEQLNGACGGAEANGLAEDDDQGECEEEVPVDENLFTEDLDELDEELNTLALED